ncbi:MAG: uroporphyrinogen decarboxylase family protein [Nitrososphaerales archaeon]
MNGRERILKTLDHEEPDMVPITEILIETVHKEALLGKKIIQEPNEVVKMGYENNVRHYLELNVEFYSKVGFDAIPYVPTGGMFKGEKYRLMPDGTVADQWGAIWGYNIYANELVYLRGGANGTTIEEFEENFPEVPKTLVGLEYLVKLAHKKGMAVYLEVDTPFVTAWYSIGINAFFKELRERPKTVKRLVSRITSFVCEEIKIAADLGVDFILSSGDFAEKNGPFMKLYYYDDIIWPNLKREVETAHSKGLKYIKHSDGNINKLLPKLSEIVDGIHSIEPPAGMNICEVKEKYGDKLVLIGNIDTSHTLPRGTKEEVIEEVKRVIKCAAPGGGYILSSSNTWVADAKLENCLAMVEAARKYGKYPIRL